MDAGYYTTNNEKTDYNSSFETIKTSLWNETSGKAHWTCRPIGTRGRNTSIRGNAIPSRTTHRPLNIFTT